MVLDPNFTPAVNTTINGLHANVTTIIANQPPQMTTATVFLVFSLLGVGLLMLSVFGAEPRGKDLSGALSSLFLLISAIQAFSVDTVTSYGATTVGTNLFLLENHTIYHYDLLGVILGIVFVISLLNLYLLWLDSKRITQQEQEQLREKRMKSRDKSDKEEDET